MALKKTIGAEMQKKRFLTKSRFLLAVDCPTKLFYTGKPKYENQNAGDDFLAMLAEGGYQVGALAKLRYPDGIEVDASSNEAAALQTTELLKKRNVVLFEPAICVGGFFVRIDILVKNGNKFELIEAKAKSYNSLDPKIEGKKGGISADNHFLTGFRMNRWQAMSHCVSTLLTAMAHSRIRRQMRGCCGS